MEQGLQFVLSSFLPALIKRVARSARRRENELWRAIERSVGRSCNILLKGQVGVDTIFYRKGGGKGYNIV